ncbi:MAG: aryl-alcohol dehydrogenase-like predicted oxidoreductase [Candidatus Latescibacterota bacterium]|jgi:aryl-alcohol dehydrogenase-like predicted oxidoreductase
MPMEYGNIDGVDKPISRILHGTIMLKTDEEEKGFELLDGVYALGVNAFDCAHIYGGGQCERVLGKWIESRGVRDKVVILTKGGHHSGDRKRVTPFDITSELHDSFARCRTDFIDIYVLHRDDLDVEVGPIVEVLNEHKAAGRIGVFGGSNWTVPRLQEANEYAYKHNLEPFSVSSPNYSLAEQVKEPWADCISLSGPENDGNRAWYAEQKMPLFTWSSLAQGFFSGRFTRETFEGYKENLPSSCVEAYCYEQNFKRLDRAGELAAEKGLSVPQIGLAFILNQPLNIFSLVGVFHPDECKANIEALNLKLSEAELDWLDLRRDDR